MALAYLPSELIQAQYFQLKNALPDPLKRRFAGFFTYYERYWIRTVTPDGFSVFGLSRRTNNVLESYNFKLGYQLQARPSPWNFIREYLDHETALHTVLLYISGWVKVGWSIISTVKSYFFA